MKKATLPNSSIRSGSRFALTAVATAMLSLSAHSALAQEGAQTDELEEIVVTGIRSSLERAADIKRNSKGVVDAISAEDIGKFPDANLAESLQRITGVSIDRSNNEGNQVTVRGFGPGFNLVTLNGRSLPTSVALAGGSFNRSFQFSHLASSSVSAVEVYKTGQAHLPTGGIGSTVNIRTAKPFDYDGLKLSGSLKANVDTTNVTGSDVTPEVSFLASNLFADGKVGLLASVSHSERDSRIEQGFVDIWDRPTNGTDAGVDGSANTNPNNALYLPRNFNFEVGDTHRERTNAQFVLQLAPTDNIEIDLDYTLSRYQEQTLRTSTGFWFGFDGQRRGLADSQGVVDVRDSGNNIDVDAFGISQDLEAHNDSFGINVDWQVNDNLRFNLDFHNSTGESQPDGQNAEELVNFRTPNVSQLGLDFIGNDIPDVLVEADFDIFDTSQLIPDIAQQRGSQVNNEIDELKFIGEYSFDDSALKTLTFGASYQDYSYSLETASTFFFLSGGNTSTGRDFDASNVGITTVERGSTFGDFSGGRGLYDRLFTYDPRVAVAQATAQGFFAPADEAAQGISEETTALFLQADFETQIADMPLTINAGVRYEQTDVDGFFEEQLVTGVTYPSAAEIRLIRSQERGFQTAQDDYDVFLPSIDFKLDITDNLLARASYSETITRSPINLLTPNTTFGALRPGSSLEGGTGIFFATQGNPGLEPSLSENIDLSVEWYYQPGSYASVGFFSKDVAAFLETDQVERPINGANGLPITNPSAVARAGCPGPTCSNQPGDEVIIFDVNQQVNSGESATIRGLEVALQHTFENGFGFIANYTFTGGDLEFKADDFEGPDPSPLPGLSDSANLVGFYENGPYQVRLAYNWRDDFLAFVGGAGEPAFTESFAQLDFSASYDINDSLTVFVEGLNVTDEKSRNFLRFEQITNRVSSSGPRYAVGLRGNF